MLDAEAGTRLRTEAKARAPWAAASSSCRGVLPAPGGRRTRINVPGTAPNPRKGKNVPGRRRPCQDEYSSPIHAAGNWNPPRWPTMGRGSQRSGSCVAPWVRAFGRAGVGVSGRGRCGQEGRVQGSAHARKAIWGPIAARGSYLVPQQWRKRGFLWTKPRSVTTRGVPFRVSPLLGLSFPSSAQGGLSSRTPSCDSGHPGKNSTASLDTEATSQPPRTASHPYLSGNQALARSCPVPHELPS